MAFSADWIETFVEKTEGMLVPEAFRRWAAITTIAGALERATYVVTDRGPLYPNLFIILTGEPASGKSLMVNEARKLWASVPEIHIGPDNPTKASFLDSLEAAARPAVNGSGMTINSCLSVACREFGVLLPKSDIAFMEDLTDIYDNPELYHAPRRSTQSVKIERPTINVLGAATPDKLGDFIPETAWGQGFTSRLIFIYGTKLMSATRDIFAKRRETDATWLKAQLLQIYKEVHGEFEWQEDARLAMNAWYNSGMQPEPTYGRLRHYNGRRDAHVLKLAMISAISAGHDLNIYLSDFERARQWLLDAEAVMPDIFRAMAQRSDQQLMDDLHHQMLGKYGRQSRDDRAPITEEDLYGFFESRVPSERIRYLIELAQKTGRLRPAGMPGTWIPNTLDQVSPGL